MNDNLRRQVMNMAFWRYFEEKTGYVPSELMKRSLENESRSNKFGIINVERKMFEAGGEILINTRKQMKNEGSPIFLAWSKVVREYGSNPENFKFKNGELDTMEAIIKSIKTDEIIFKDFDQILQSIEKNNNLIDSNRFHKKKKT